MQGHCEKMDVPDEISKIDLDDMPPGYILVRQEDGIYSFVKLEPQEQEEIIEEVEDVEVGETPEVDEEEVIDESNQKNLMKLGARYLALPDKQTLGELEIDEIPDIIEEELIPGSFDHTTATEAQVEFIEASTDPEFGTMSITVSNEKTPRKHPPPYGSVHWKGMQIPAGLTPEEVARFKGRHTLLRLLEQVKRNRSKVEIYSKKNDELKRLISSQRAQMTRMGFNAKEIARFHCSRRRSRSLPRPLSPEINKAVMKDTERLAYEKKRLEAEYSFYRKCLKAILSSHRRYKKIFVDNHEKMQKGPPQKPFQGTPGIHLMKQAVPEAMHHMSDDSDSDSEQSDGQDPKPPKVYKCYHCSFSAASKRSLVPHIKTHLIPPKVYECPECSYSTNRVTQFLEHMKLHPGAKAFTCEHCDFKTAHPSALKNHQALHMAVKPYKCPMCTLRFGRSDHLRNHMRCHSNVRNYKCELCPYSSKYASGLSNHIRRLHKKLYQQKKMALKQTQNNADMKDEESDDPGETTEIEVDETGKISAIRTINRKIAEGDSDGGEHLARMSSRRRVKNKVYADFTDGEEFDEVVKTEGVDEGDNNEGSEVSGEFIEEEVDGEYETLVEDAPGTFYEDLGEGDEEEDREENAEDRMIAENESDYAESQLTTKTETSTRKDLLSSYVIYQCVWCDFNCEMKRTLLDHSRTHMLSWTFTCKACGFEAKTPNDLQSHTEDHKNAGEFDCWYCDYTTSNKLKLKKHVAKRHPAGKPMSCMYCEFITSSRLAMKNHMTSHKAKKMWQCLACDYKAPFRSSLKRHLRKHTGERPYCCPHCEFNASQYSHLTRHLRKYHPEEPALLENRPPSPFVPIF